MRAYSVRTPGDPVQYGVKTVRQLRQVRKIDLLDRERTTRQKQKQAIVFEYFRTQVDPIIQDCVAFLLCAQPLDAAGVMLDYLCHWRDGKRKEFSLPENTKKTSKIQRLYLATQINPIITRIVNEIAKLRPENIVEFVCDELVKIIAEEKLTGTIVEEAGAPKELLTPAKDKRPATADSITSPCRANGVPASINGGNNQTIATPIARPESAPVAANKPMESMAMEVQIAMLGIASSGKTSVINSLQGKDTSRVRPTNGFRPVTMMLGEELKIRFYDLGGGKKIRDIWEQYYHDTHAYIYVIDASAPPDELSENAEVYRKITQHPYVASKPGLILANKQDKEGAANADLIKQVLAISNHASINVQEVSCASPASEGDEDAVMVTDPRLEQALLWLLDQIRADYGTISEKVRADSAKKDIEENNKRIAKERAVLRNKIACAFLDQIDKSLPGLNVESANPNDLFGEVDGPKFLAGEIGVEVEQMDPIAHEVSHLIGNQRLALQMVGAMNVPISKKKVPLSWSEIRTLVMELRQELGLTPSLQ